MGERERESVFVRERVCVCVCECVCECVWVRERERERERERVCVHGVCGVCVETLTAMRLPLQVLRGRDHLCPRLPPQPQHCLPRPQTREHTAGRQRPHRAH